MRRPKRSNTPRLLTRLGIALTVFGVTTTAARSAAACGGTFCDANPGPVEMPVDQTGENVLFVVDGDTIEAHVQIQYDGDAESFAWLVPMMAVPEVEVGSEPLFQALLAATVPTFTLLQRFEGTCDDDRGVAMCGMALSDAGAELAAGDDGEDSSGGETPSVVISGTAGAFEYAVLDGGTVAGVLAWLDDNGYAQDDEAAPILQQYLDEGFVFTAFKLRAGAGVDAIHPVVLRYQGDEPCVPIRLTRIAAKPDMGVRVFFLGEARMAPTNYRHVVINPLRIEWASLGSNYGELVTLAVDGDGANGHAFVTEYAGTPALVPTVGVRAPAWDAARFAELPGTAVIDALIDQGLMRCDDGCVPQHTLVAGLLRTYLPTPGGYDDDDWWAALRAGGAEPSEWDGAGFAAAMQERIVAPGEHAVELLGAHAMLTRLFTTLSPVEMTADPLFHANSALPPVSNRFLATQVFNCDGHSFIELEDGRIIRDDDDGSPARLDLVPAALRVESMPDNGAPMLLVDHDGVSADALAAWNEAHDGRSGQGCSIGRLHLHGLIMLGLLGAGVHARRRRPRTR